MTTSIKNKAQKDCKTDSIINQMFCDHKKREEEKRKRKDIWIEDIFIDRKSRNLHKKNIYMSFVSRPTSYKSN